jgi:hypothetical protein
MDGTATIVSIGDGSSGNRADGEDVTMASSNVNASDLVLSAGTQVNLSTRRILIRRAARTSRTAQALERRMATGALAYQR